MTPSRVRTPARAQVDRPIFWQLVRSTGYYVVRREWADMGFGRFTGIDTYDEEQCVRLLVEIFEAERDARRAAGGGEPS